MKKTIVIIIFLLARFELFAQTPERMSYQSVLRDANNQLVSNTNVGIQISIIRGSATGTLIFTERHFVTTNASGLVSIEIGSGTVLTGQLDTINWIYGKHYIKSETDLKGGANYTISGTSQLLSVPYALHSKISERSLSETDPVFANSIAYTIDEKDTLLWTNKQNKLKSGSGIVIKNDTISNTAKDFSHYIGENAEGGIIFSLWKDSSGIEHGLVVAIDDQAGGISGNNIVWSSITNNEIGVGARSSWDGLSNSNAIISQTGHVFSAAKLCLDYTYGNYSDYYLPSINEISMLWQNLFMVNQSLSKIKSANVFPPRGPIGFSYWTSCEIHGGAAYFFSNGLVGQTSKLSNSGVRAIRKF